HFRRNEEDTNYFATIKLNDERIDFSQNGSELILQEPAWLLTGNKLITFTKETDGNKLKPFLNKKFIKIPKSAEANYFEKFVKPLIEQYDVYAVGFDIVSESHVATPVLKLENLWTDKVCATLYFNYGNYQFPYHSKKWVSVSLENVNDNFVFRRIRRQRKTEDLIRTVLENIGLKLYDGSLFISDEQSAGNLALVEILSRNKSLLEERGFIIEQNLLSRKFVLTETLLSFDVEEHSDWFDLKGMVKFGEFLIPFLKLKHHLLNGRREYLLPDNTIAVIPEEWFEKYSSLFDFGEEENEHLKIKKHHFALLDNLSDQKNTSTAIDNLKNLQDAENLAPYPLPVGLKARMRPYQASGYNWIQTLKELKLGGCLADDMGLGKTLQALAVLQYYKEKRKQIKSEKKTIRKDLKDKEQVINNEEQIFLFSDEKANVNSKKKTENSDVATRASLVIVPTSLVFNWESEAKKFTALKTFVYGGFHRNKELLETQSRKHDIIICTYGTVRNDIELFSKIFFNTIILDEAQAIKNPLSQTALAVNQLRSESRLVLTGTPLENSITDLWSQMNFLNPGLLGSYQSFTKKYIQAVEKDKNPVKTQELRNLIKPFILRRTKQEVAKDLPEKYEQVLLCDMTEEQQSLYDSTKIHFRNEMLKSISNFGFNKSQMMILKGLMKLRQIANHPAMTQESYLGDSGKFTELMRMADEAIANGHKVLIFSQFVKQLTIFRKHFDFSGTSYNYLDGSTLPDDRRKQVENFQSDSSIKLFLISLKAGGVGLNLTAADYVFIVDPWWNPAAERQAMDRTHRIGQSKTVFVYKFITRNTVEEKILKLQHRKLLLSESLVENNEFSSAKIGEKEISMLLE
ncbi:MAG: DEAD/DEAH box helicase, partial [Bacteroidia bacterium]|nr:DEAD/DEAH box helicase [Bacteroidia bacterium]